MQSNEISTGVLLHPAGQEATSCLDKKCFKESEEGEREKGILWLSAVLDWAEGKGDGWNFNLPLTTRITTYIHTLTHTHTHTCFMDPCLQGLKRSQKESLCKCLWEPVSIRPINATGGQTHLRAWDTRFIWPPPPKNCLALNKELHDCLKQAFVFKLKLDLSPNHSQKLFVRMCVIIWEELRGSCWEDICVRAWHLTLDLWMEFTHTHSFQLLRRDHCHCYAASVLIDTDWWVLKLCCSYAKDNIRRKRQYACWKINERNRNAQYNRFRNGIPMFKKNQMHFWYKYICTFLYIYISNIQMYFKIVFLFVTIFIF